MNAIASIRDGLLALDHDTRAFALVGLFMSQSAMLEQALGLALSQVLEFGGYRTMILTRNVGFDERVRLLHSLSLACLPDNADHTVFAKFANQDGELAARRQVVRNTPFQKSPNSDGVEFFVASGGSKLVEMDWSTDQFLLEMGKMEAANVELRSFETRMLTGRMALVLRNASSSETIRLVGSLASSRDRT